MSSTLFVERVFLSYYSSFKKVKLFKNLYTIIYIRLRIKGEDSYNIIEIKNIIKAYEQKNAYMYCSN